MTLTGLDEENILLSLFAKANSNAKLITKVTKIAFTEIINNLDIGSVIYPKHLTADYILQYVRAMSNSIGVTSRRCIKFWTDAQKRWNLPSMIPLPSRIFRWQS